MNRIKQTIILLVFVPQVMLAGTIVVDQSGSGDYTTIGAAVSAASSGDTIRVKVGIYTEGVVLVGKNLVIIGDGAETTSIINASYAILLSTMSGSASGGETIEIKGFTIKSSSNYAINLEGSGSSKRVFIIKKCIIESEKGAVYTGSGNPLSTGEASMEAKIYNSVLKNSVFGVLVWGEGGSVSITNCLFTENTNGVDIGRPGNPAGHGIIQNSIFYDNSVGLARQENFRATALSLYNSFFSNSTTNYSAVSAGTGDITSDPKFNDISQGYSVSSSSPLIDAGNPSSAYNDPDGTRNDMGLYGGPFTWSAGPVVSAISISSASVGQGTSVTITATAKSK